MWKLVLEVVGECMRCRGSLSFLWKQSHVRMYVTSSGQAPLHLTAPATPSWPTRLTSVLQFLTLPSSTSSRITAWSAVIIHISSIPYGRDSPDHHQNFSIPDGLRSARMVPHIRCCGIVRYARIRTPVLRHVFYPAQYVVPRRVRLFYMRSRAQARICLRWRTHASG